MTWGAGKITIHIHTMLYARIGVEQVLLSSESRPPGSFLRSPDCVPSLVQLWLSIVGRSIVSSSLE